MPNGACELIFAQALSSQETDDDSDGQTECGGDCNDANSANFAGNTEVCDGQDNDCNGALRACSKIKPHELAHTSQDSCA